MTIDIDNFRALTAHLKSTEVLWKPRPFVGLPVSWESAFPKMSRALRSLTVTEVEAIRSDLTKIVSVSPELSDLYHRNEQLTGFPALEAQDGLIDPRRNPLRVSGRKWRQIERFASAVIPRSSGLIDRWVDWCSGKGHLGRALSDVSGIETIFVERNPELCEAGFVNADVLEDDLNHLFSRGSGAVALHACGNLNAKLLQCVVKSDCRFLAVAPCCYQRIVGHTYVPLSETGSAQDLHLGSHHLRLVSFEEVVLGRGAKARRNRDHIYRLAFDLLAREATGTDRYRPLGPLPGAFFGGTFEQFAKRVAQKEKIDLPRKWDPLSYETRGKARWELNRALSLVRSLFARCLESWLFSDRVLFLQENGWFTEAGTFCDRKVTPRNLLIIARPR
ncbi:MAG: methyltransferase [Deltaproteobacteria bacterium]|nr:methyltransferase [Deltaproteobacteria bacterium]